MRDSLTNKLADLIAEMVQDGVAPEDFIRESQLCWIQVLDAEKERVLKIFNREKR